MGLLIKSTEDKKIMIDGTDFELPSIYARIQFIANMDGITMEVQYTTYANHAAYTANKFLFTTFPMSSLTIEIAANETQDLATALNYVKQYAEMEGYEVEIV